MVNNSIGSNKMNKTKKQKQKTKKRNKTKIKQTKYKKERKRNKHTSYADWNLSHLILAILFLIIGYKYTIQ